MFRWYICHHQCDSYESLQLIKRTCYNVQYDVTLRIVFQHNVTYTAHCNRYVLSAVNFHNCHTDVDRCTVKTYLLKFKKSHYFLKITGNRFNQVSPFRGFSSNIICANYKNFKCNITVSKLNFKHLLTASRQHNLIEIPFIEGLT